MTTLHERARELCRAHGLLLATRNPCDCGRIESALRAYGVELLERVAHHFEVVRDAPEAIDLLYPFEIAAEIRALIDAAGEKK